MESMKQVTASYNHSLPATDRGKLIPKKEDYA